jgi:hypothetical protein
MSAANISLRSEESASAKLRLSKLQRGGLWLFVVSSAFVIIEPSPYEFMFVVVLLLFGLRDLQFDRSMIPLVLWPTLFNVGGVLALLPYLDDRKAVIFIAISIYIEITALFFAALIAKNPLQHMRTIRSAYVVAGFIASCIGIAGYFDVAGLGEYFTLYGRASATFKDPNVFGPFLAPPLVWLTQDILLKRPGSLMRGAAPLLVMLLGLLLSFSRGAWGVWFASTAAMVALTFLTTQSSALRRRIVTLSAFGSIAVAVLLIVALSIPQIRDVFEIRASLTQDYDLGQFGRFGAQAQSIPMLMDLPFGFGPLQYHYHFFGVDPHETFINAFASYGWIGGLSYLAFVAATLYCGSRLIFLRTPLQNESIAVVCCLFVQIFQGFQIDTDHWRHLYLLFGAMYGLFAASLLYLNNRASQAANVVTDALLAHTEGRANPRGMPNAAPSRFAPSGPKS